MASPMLQGYYPTGAPPSALPVVMMQPLAEHGGGTARTAIHKGGQRRPNLLQGVMPPTLAMPPQSNCPPGLEILTQMDHIIVRQQVEWLEAICGCETENRYKIKDGNGMDIFRAKEDTDCCTRNCCGPVRPFDLVIKDHSEREVIHVERPLRCTSCWFPCCLQQLSVFAPPGVPVGSINQDWTICIPHFSVYDESGNYVLRIEGPCCTSSCCCADVVFTVFSVSSGNEVGKISKKWSGFLKEAFTDADNFGISFPMDLDVRMKATLIGALFLIDYMFFEKQQNKENDKPGMMD